MTGTARIVVTLAVFAAMVALVVVRPRRWNDAWWTMLGAAAMLVLGLVTPREAIGAILSGKNALLFLLSLLALSLLVGKSGFFDWAAIRCALVAKGDAHSLYRNAFVAGAIVTAVLSLDTTAVMLTPVLLALVKRLKVPAAPYVVLCAFVANVGSLALPISNLTNLLFADAFHQTFAAFAARMIVPQLVALVTTYAILRWHFRRALPDRFDGESLPEPASVVANRAYFLVCVTVLAVVLICYFLAPLMGLEPYVFAFAGSAVLAFAGVAGGRVRIRAVRELAWDLFPFVIGLFIAVQGLENLGIVGVESGWLASMRPGSPEKLLTAAGALPYGNGPRRAHRRRRGTDDHSFRLTGNDARPRVCAARWGRSAYRKAGDARPVGDACDRCPYDACPGPELRAGSVTVDRTSTADEARI
jgi:arsenical pump membrane protein